MPKKKKKIQQEKEKKKERRNWREEGIVEEGLRKKKKGKVKRAGKISGRASSRPQFLGGGVEERCSAMHLRRGRGRCVTQRALWAWHEGAWPQPSEAGVERLRQGSAAPGECRLLRLTMRSSRPRRDTPLEAGVLGRQNPGLGGWAAWLLQASVSPAVSGGWAGCLGRLLVPAWRPGLALEARFLFQCSLAAGPNLGVNLEGQLWDLGQVTSPLCLGSRGWNRLDGAEGMAQRVKAPDDGRRLSSDFHTTAVAREHTSTPISKC